MNLSGKLAAICSMIGWISNGNGGESVYSKEYEEAKKEFVNCLCMGLIGIGVPIVLAFTEWWPIMKREKQKALAQQSAEKTSSAA